MKRLSPVLILAGTVAVVYLNSFRGAFQFDDYLVIVDNAGVHSWSAFLAGLPRGIRPLLKFTYTLNWTSGLGLFGFHLVNVALHAANAVLLFLLASRVVGASGFAALLSALLFAVHPVQTEAVTYICGRSVSLMAFFYLGSLLAYLRGRERRSRSLLYLASPILFLLATASKEVALTLPFALVLCEAVRRERTGWEEVFRAQAVHWVLLGSLAVLFIAHAGYGRLLEVCFDIRGAADNLSTQLHGIPYLLSRLFLPHALNFDPDLPVFSGWSTVLLPEALLLSALLAAGFIGLWKRSAAGFGILWFFLHLVPTNSFIPRFDVANERQLYLSSWGLFLALAYGADLLRERCGVRGVTAVAVLLVVTLGGFTVSRNAVYRSQVALWEDTARKSPGKARVQNNLGYSYELSGRFKEAEAAYLKALLIDPGYSLARGNLKGMKAKWKTPGSPAPPAAPAAPAAGASPAREAAPAAPGG
ncbi:MAG: Tetratricopeptide 2 repeat protein [Deltaproteobacteria bacterium]|nr:Tetratricopeptide 2 repeat protein [Deltaproteobacteria bacterium]